MSTRWYPLYAKGNPQLRVYLPNFWMKLVKPDKHTSSLANVVHFRCSMEMTKHDVKNYLEKIYNVYPVSVRTRIVLGAIKLSQTRRQMYKIPDYKLAYVTLSEDEKFTYPKLFAKWEAEDSIHGDRKEQFEAAFKDTNQNTPSNGISWF